MTGTGKVRAPGVARMLRADAALARVELALSAVLLAAMLVCMAAAAVARSAGRPLVWSDELSVYLVASSAFFAASAALAGGKHMSVDIVSRRMGQGFQRAVDGVLLLAVSGFAVCLWTWFDPAGLLRHGSAQDLARETANFVYSEPTMTLGVSKVWFWLPMVPATVGAMLHVAARLVRGGPC